MKLFVERLTVMDFSFLHARRGLVGESWWLDIVLEGGWTNRAWCSISAK